MPLRTDYINTKIKWFQKHNPQIFHQEIHQQLYQLYSRRINYMDIGYIERTVQHGSSNERRKRINCSNISNMMEDCKEITFTQEFHGYKFKVNVERTEDNIHINVLTYDAINPLHCVVINIERKSKLAFLTDISNYGNCAKITKPVKSGLVKNVSGSLIFKFVLYLLKKNKKTLGIDRITLTDNSTKICPNCNKNIDLAGMSFLIYGNTWYGKYGFLPYDIDNNIPDEEYIKVYNRNNRIIERTKTKDVKLKKYVIDGVKENKLNDIDVKHLIKMIDEWKDEKLFSVLKAILKDYNKHCCLFTYIQKKIYYELRMQNFRRFSFYLDI